MLEDIFTDMIHARFGWSFASEMISKAHDVSATSVAVDNNSTTGITIFGEYSPLQI